jgi:putative tryptophan/tyrosine transport system substrate-binding protein
MKRRRFVTPLRNAAAVWPITARAQQPVRWIGVLMAAAADDRNAQDHLAALLQGLQQSAWSVGHNVRIEYRWSASDGQTTSA